METQLTPWGWFECDFWIYIGSGVFQFSTPLHSGIFIEPEYNEKLPASFRQSSGVYKGQQNYYLAVAAYHQIFDMQYSIFDEETVQQAHYFINSGEFSLSISLIDDDRFGGYIRLVLLLLLLFSTINIY